MPTYQNASLVLNLTYTSVQPAAAAVYTDAAGIKYTVLSVVGTGASAKYYVTVVGYNNLGPAAGALTKVSGTGDASVTMNSFINNPRAIVGQSRIEPGQAVTTMEFSPVVPDGVTQTSAAPFYNPVLLSQTVSSTSTVAIPRTVLGNYRVRIHVSVGEVSVKLNSTDGTARIIGTGDVYSVFCSTRIIDNIIFTISSGTATLTVEAS